MSSLDAILNLTTLYGRDGPEAFQTMGVLIDYANAKASPDLAQGAGPGGRAGSARPQPEDTALLEYFRANARDVLYHPHVAGWRRTIWTSSASLMIGRTSRRP